jgi:hypothetical protein
LIDLRINFNKAASLIKEESNKKTSLFNEPNAKISGGQELPGCEGEILLPPAES